MSTHSQLTVISLNEDPFKANALRELVPNGKAPVNGADAHNSSDISRTRKGCTPRSVLKHVTQLAICFGAGILFGLALEKGRVFEPRAIRDQMVFRRYIMLKMFIAAVGAGQLFLIILSVLPCTKNRFQEASDAFVGCFADKGLMAATLGPFILGIGMTLSGACPGMVLAQLGAWAPNAIFTMFGALVGALLYGMVAPYVVKLTKPRRPLKNQMVHKQFGIPYVAVALPCVAMMTVAVFLIEYFHPWYWDTKVEYGSNIFTIRAWPPWVSGILIGFLQVPVLLAIADTLGGSSSYVTLVSQWVVTPKLQTMFPYLAKMRCGLSNWWQVIYVAGAILGGAISSLASNTHATVEGVAVHVAFIGGMLMLIGARLGAGCTSGHGLSGVGLLAWLSFLAVPAMFAGAIATAFAMQATGALDQYVNKTLDM